MSTTAPPPSAAPPESWDTPLSVVAPVMIFALSALAYPLAVAPTLGLNADQRATWILGLYLLPAVASALVSWYCRLPLIIGWSSPAIIFLASAAATAGYSDMLGAMLVTGVVLIALGWSGLSAKISTFIPAPIVFGVVAGSILPFLVRAFDFLGTTPGLIGTVFITWIIVRKYFEPRVPALLLAFAAGLMVAWLTGNTGTATRTTLLPEVTLTLPTFSIAAIATIVPVFVVLISANSNLSVSVIIRNAGDNPPRRMADVVSGIGVLGGSLFGVVPMALSSNLNALPTGDGKSISPVGRHWSVYVAVIGFLLIAGTAAILANLPNLIPMSLLLTAAALALLTVFIQMLSQIASGPILIGPVVALAVSLSELTLFGLGSFFWALVFGTLVTRVLEPEALQNHCALIESQEGWCRVPAKSPEMEEPGWRTRIQERLRRLVRKRAINRDGLFR